MFVSILMPSYNYASLMGEAIDSVLNQTYQDFELLIADDGSTDHSWEVLKRYAGKHPGKIRIFRHPENRNAGLAAAYQLAFRHARGSLIAFLEADDTWHPRCLETRVKAFESFPSAGVVTSAYDLQGDPRGCLYWTIYQAVNRLSLQARTPQNTLSFYLRRNPAASFSHFMIRREVYESVPEPGAIELFFDWWVLAHASAAADFVYLPERLSTWRIHSKSANFGAVDHPKLIRLKNFMNRLYLSLNNLPLNAAQRKTLDKERRRMLDYPGFLEGRTLPQLFKEPVEALRFLCHMTLNRFLLKRAHENAAAKP